MFIATVNICIYFSPPFLFYIIIIISYSYIINYLLLYVSRNARRQLEWCAIKFETFTFFFFNLKLN